MLESKRGKDEEEMRLIITYELSGKYPDLDHLRKGPLATGLEATNSQLEAEDSKVRLKIVEVGDTSLAECLLYECVRELQNVQDAHEACGSRLCASALGEKLIALGMDCLGVEQLAEETLEKEVAAEAKK